MASSLTGRFKELLKKYGKVALGVHFSVSAASITGLYVAIKNNADVESIFSKLHLPGVSGNEQPEGAESSSPPVNTDGFVAEDTGIDLSSSTPGMVEEEAGKKRNRTAELVASTGGALTLAVLCNKALFPVRVPITIAVTPPVARFLARRRIIKDSNDYPMDCVPEKASEIWIWSFSGFQISDGSASSIPSPSFSIPSGHSLAFT
ncbi:uncharacterized protein LOC116202243 isoform X2 [Punica granatum]|uniref:Uncharacterized protein LOC116202243 isoform X2 n=1 Tax=Punica granatum TaxID=22663 RepID=A0A6P8D7R1_PUNGR|nr:uncharacterized protein LOC116202243 isoform X2 [Punica granatum]